MQEYTTWTSKVLIDKWSSCDRQKNGSKKKRNEIVTDYQETLVNMNPSLKIKKC